MANIHVINFGDAVSYWTFKFVHEIGLIKTNGFGGGVVACDEIGGFKLLVVDN